LTSNLTMDNAHFDSEGYRKLGRRYGVQMLFLMGEEANNICDPEIYIAELEKLSLGTYFYTIKTDEFRQTKKMILQSN
jgi:hypothetical protein